MSEAALAALHAEADLFVSASRHEGYGMAVADALAAGLPVVARAAGALVDLVPPAFQVSSDQELAARVARLARDPEAMAEARSSAADQRSTFPRWEDTSRAFLAALVRFTEDDGR